ncbi:MAG: choice-of-anchor J domain-containing protein [Chitinophagaceae bacterium]|jgi:hypothetical protein
MKKLLLASALVLAMPSAKAQLALQNFNAAGIPTGWTMINVDGKTISTDLNTLIQSGLKANAWMKWLNTTGDSMMITTSLFTTTGAADRWLITPSFNVTSADMMLAWYDAQPYSSTGASDDMEVLVSTTGGTTTGSFTTNLGTSTPITSGFAKKSVSLAAFNGQNVRIAFRNVGNNAGVLALDNVQTETATASTDASLDAIGFPSIVPPTSVSVQIQITNKGTTTITSVQASYAVDGGTPVSQTFSTLKIMPGTSKVLTFTTGITGTTVANHTLATTILQVNGAADADATNNTKSSTFLSASKSVNRSGLLEEFTSSTCAPCASFNSTFDPYILSIPANVPASRFNVIKYQMNWPSPNNDVCYNNEGNTRKSYYGVTGIPDHYTNGDFGGSGDATEVAASKADPAFMDITGTYVIKKDSLIADVTVTPHFTLASANYRLHMAALEYNYTNPGATTSQKQYYHVMRNMAGAGAGITISSVTSGVAQKFRWAVKYTTGTPAQLTNTFWASPITGNLVAFVQNNTTKEVFQSVSIPATWPTGIENLNSVISQSSVYPNPASDHTTIAFKLESSTSVGIQVVDAMGRVVYSVADQQMNAGTQAFEINTSSFASGVYTIKVKADNGFIVERFSVVK